jgi:hypothetical protein
VGGLWGFGCDLAGLAFWAARGASERRPCRIEFASAERSGSRRGGPGEPVCMFG